VTEHVLQEISGHYPNWRERNAATQLDHTRFFSTVPATELNTALAVHVEAQRLYNGSQVGEAELNHARADVLEQIKETRRSPYHFLPTRIAEILFGPEHPYSRSPLGSVAGVTVISRFDIQDFVRSRYGAENIILIIAGDLDVPTVRKQVVQHFGRIAGGKLSNAHAIPCEPGKPALPHRVLIDAEVPGERFYKVWITPPYGSPELDYLDLFRYVLDMRLEERLVGGGHALSVATNLRAYKDCGQFELAVSASQSASLHTLDRLVEGELRSALRELPPTEDLRLIAREMIESFTEEIAADIGAKATLLGLSELRTGDPGHYRKVLQRMQVARAATMIGTARKWLQRSTAVVHVRSRLRSSEGEGS
jgi:predicted Zn-dependent peptidase